MKVDVSRVKASHEIPLNLKPPDCDLVVVVTQDNIRSTQAQQSYIHTSLVQHTPLIVYMWYNCNDVHLI